VEPDSRLLVVLEGVVLNCGSGIREIHSTIRTILDVAIHNRRVAVDEVDPEVVAQENASVDCWRSATDRHSSRAIRERGIVD